LPNELLSVITKLLRNPLDFCEQASGLKLRGYQEQVALSIVDSIKNGRGLSFVVEFPRQSGKNELQAQIEAYILLMLSDYSAEVVKISPTWKPQTLNAMRRLERVLQKNLITRAMWAKESGYIYRLNTARIFFFSGGPQANIVGATASTLLEVDEAQDVEIAKFDKDIAPMAASTNATRVFWGTAWTSRTLLHRELAAAKAAQQRDGIRRVFVLDADQVAAEVPAYGAFVAEQVAKLGRNNPMIKTQFFSEEIDAESGMFPTGRRALLYGPQPAQEKPAPGAVYAFLIDVAGEDEQAAGTPGSDQQLTNPGRDSTALTIVEVDCASIADPALQRPTYKVVMRRTWTGKSQTFQYSQLKSLAETWQPRYLAIDATGIGAGLSSFLAAAFPGKVLPFVFTSPSKSKLGWDFISIIETGRFKEFAPADDLFIEQLTFTILEVQPGPAHLIKWGVPDGTRNPATGDLVHDDLVLSAALTAVLDEQEWGLSGPALVVTAKDPMLEMDRGF
jgi:hypothetical protein